MQPLIKLDNACLNYGTNILLDQQTLQIASGERVCLIGRNGAGKSSLMKVLSGQIALDDGTLWRDPNLKVARLEQDLPDADDLTVYDAVAQGLAEVGQLLSQYHHAVSRSATDPKALDEMSRLQQSIESRDGWLLGQKVDAMMTRLQLPAEKTMSQLSGGWRRRVSLARALVCDPDVLLLDEPTNHLDVQAIEWLEQQLLEFRGAIVFITHDRAFLQRLATRIIELDRGILTSFPGTYDDYLNKKAELLEQEARQNALFDKRLAEEEKWIRQGIKARRTRNEGRVRALKAMREERSERRERMGTASATVEEASRSGKLVAELTKVSHGYGDRHLIDNFSSVLMRGDRVGLIGPNGAGKSTLLKLFLGQLTPQSGNVRLGTKLEIAYFDQLRQQLNLEETPVDNIAEGREFIEINGQRKHVIGYLGDFLFTGARARTPLKALSGGERNRVLLAKLFSKPSNMLVLDEPTNDLDVETLELLEELLTQYTGTLLLVSHDRRFLDNVVSSTIAFEGDGRVAEYVGGYQDWIKQGGKWHDPETDAANKTERASEVDTSATEGLSSEKTSMATQPAPAEPPKKIKKLSYKLQRELDQLPAEIEILEEAIEGFEAKMAAPAFFNGDQNEVQEMLSKVSEAQNKLQTLYDRWEELDAM